MKQLRLPSDLHVILAKPAGRERTLANRLYDCNPGRYAYVAEALPDTKRIISMWVRRFPRKYRPLGGPAGTPMPASQQARRATAPRAHRQASIPPVRARQPRVSRRTTRRGTGRDSSDGESGGEPPHSNRRGESRSGYRPAVGSPLRASQGGTGYRTAGKRRLDGPRQPAPNHACHPPAFLTFRTAALQSVRGRARAPALPPYLLIDRAGMRRDQEWETGKYESHIRSEGC